MPSSPIPGSGEGQLLSPSPIIRPPRPRIICSDSEDDGTPGYPAALPLSPPVLTVDPRAVFAYDAADSGDDGTSVDVDEESDSADPDNNNPDAATTLAVGAVSNDDSDSAITISDDSDSAITISDDDDDTALSVSDGDSESPLQVTTNPNMPATTVSSLIVEDGSADEHSSHIFDDSDEDWGFPSIDDPELLAAIGHALDDPFGWGTGDGRD